MLKFEAPNKGPLKLFNKGKRKSHGSPKAGRISLTHSVDSETSAASGQPMVENHYVTTEVAKAGGTGPRQWTPPSHFVPIRGIDFGGMALAPWHVDGSSTVCTQNCDGAKGKIMTARCISSYRATHAMELTIREGDLVYNVHDVGIKDWLKGSVGGMYGHFPADKVVVLGAASAHQQALDFSPSASTHSLGGSELPGDATPGLNRSGSLQHARILPQIPGQEDNLQYAEVVRNTGELDDLEAQLHRNHGDGGSIYDELVYDEMNYEAMTITQAMGAEGKGEDGEAEGEEEVPKAEEV